MSLKGIKVIISGRVQGVYFRKYTRKKALALNLTGWVQNLDDGSVSLEAFGEPSALQAFEQWLHKGPVLAKVKSVECQPIAFEQHHTFSITDATMTN